MGKADKEFENRIRQAFERQPGVIVERLPDQMSKFKGSTNPSDFMVYKCPILHYIECKKVEGTSLPFSNITQWQDLLERSRYEGTVCGVIVWFMNKEVTNFVDIRLLECMKQEGYKSLSYKERFDFEDSALKSWEDYWFPIDGVKKRKYYDYNMREFLNFTRSYL